VERRLLALAERVDRIDQLRRSFDPDGPLKRGFARVHQADGALVRAAAALRPGEAVQIVFADGRRGAVMEGAVVEGETPLAKRAPKPAQPESKTAGKPVAAQGDLF
jgi:exodeoxyribonuclease VII large subunit